MSEPYVVTVLVTSGDPDGVRVVEKSNWTGQAIVFARSDLAEANQQDLNRPGVYVLIGDDGTPGVDRPIYVGQAESVASRLKQHASDSGKDFWTSTVVFVAKDQALNRADILFVESRLVELATSAKRSVVQNGNQPPLPALSAVDHAKANGFLREMLGIFPVLGVNEFEKIEAAVKPGTIRYAIKGPDALGEGEERSDGFVVFAGATARIEETPTIQPGWSKRRAAMLAAGAFVQQGGKYVLTVDTLFSSPSAAAGVLLARNANGREEWKTANGTTLKAIQVAELEGNQ